MTTEDDAEIERLAGELRRARGLGIAARRALVLARRYRAEDGPRGDRELACVTQALTWRAAARLLRDRSPNAAGGVARPGLARATAPAGNPDRRTG